MQYYAALFSDIKYQKRRGWFTYSCDIFAEVTKKYELFTFGLS